ncbi:MAG TPA: hypothetical protein VMG59_08570 [Phycisphaerae bacterium]|nr:hypothetical protein [Phycisphaerae bacterium]
MTPSIKCKGVAILTAAAIGGLVAGVAAKPVQASSIAGVSPHSIATSGSATSQPSTEPNGCSSKSGCQGKNHNSCSSNNGCQGK